MHVDLKMGQSHFLSQGACKPSCIVIQMHLSMQLKVMAQNKGCENVGNKTSIKKRLQAYA